MSFCHTPTGGKDLDGCWLGIDSGVPGCNGILYYGLISSEKSNNNSFLQKRSLSPFRCFVHEGQVSCQGEPAELPRGCYLPTNERGLKAQN